MSLAWPHLVQLSFCGGNSRERSQTSFSILKAFATDFPYIQRLAISLHIDPDISAVELVPTRFANLQKLYLDTSSVRDQQSAAVATLLTLICPPGVKILFGRRAPQQTTLRGKLTRAMEGAMRRRWESIVNGVNSYYNSVYRGDGDPKVAAMYFRQWFANQP
ncbi:hypothetical protein FRB95_013806 [Tulasnella sp. JGI-2019a]|nr:hypothetical protein FRB95_013806 [Tulasnella sp. JGI-2019a]